MMENTLVLNATNGTPDSSLFHTGQCADRPRSISSRRVANSDSLVAYYRYLKMNLGFPFRAWNPEPTLPDEPDEYPCAVLGLIDPEIGPCNELDGLYCLVAKGEYLRELPLIEMELPEDDPNFALVEQYWDWFWNCGKTA